jgi:hypothetical protein
MFTVFICMYNALGLNTVGPQWLATAHAWSASVLPQHDKKKSVSAEYVVPICTYLPCKQMSTPVHRYNILPNRLDMSMYTYTFQLLFLSLYYHYIVDKLVLGISLSQASNMFSWTNRVWHIHNIYMYQV